jgi:SPFH domain / Band 7 family
MFDPSSWPLILGSVAAIILSVAALSQLFAAGAPDEWLLLIRGGKLIRAGIGIFVVRLPGDSIVRFSSTLQRVAFQVECRSAEHITLTIDGFALWNVIEEGDGPFRAYRTLGLANLQKPPSHLRSPRHLLAAPQYKAFQSLFAACTQRLTPHRTLQSLLDDPDDLLRALDQCVREHADELGIRIEQVQVLSIRPTDHALVEQLAAEQEAQLREHATLARRASEQRVEEIEIASTTKLANDRAQAEFEQEAYALQQQVSLQRRKLEAEREELEIERERMETRQRLELQKLEADAAIASSRQTLDQEQQLARDTALRQHESATLERQRDQLAFEVEGTRLRAEAQGAAIQIVTAAEEGKSPALREQQIVELVATKLGDAVSSLPIQDVHWSTWSGESPLTMLGQALSGLRSAMAQPREPTPKMES